MLDKLATPIGRNLAPTFLMLEPVKECDDVATT